MRPGLRCEGDLHRRPDRNRQPVGCPGPAATVRAFNHPGDVLPVLLRGRRTQALHSPRVITIEPASNKIKSSSKNREKPGSECLPCQSHADFKMADDYEAMVSKFL